jgi:D-alanyl-lipoteichoic acid acyltransferase DltB (MBOAT superfamily)
MIGEIQGRNESFDLFCTGFYRFAVGLIKKVLIADQISLIVSSCFDCESLSVASAWIGAIAYTLQIYFDFSGCTDMAIGIGNIFGFNFTENFNYPYTAVSVSDFWKRWHISLTKWFTKYIYIPLGGNRVSKSRHILNIAVVWLFTGIWHGANWTFIIWGMLYCVFLLLEKYTKLKSFVESHKLIGHIYTMLVVVLLWVIFRAGSAADAIRFIGNMFGFGATSFCDNATKDLLMSSLIPLVIGAIFALPIKDKIYGISTKCEKAFKPIFTVIIIVLSILAICCCVSMGSNESVALYANF